MFVPGRRLPAAIALLALAVTASACSSGGSKPVTLPSLAATQSATPTAIPSADIKAAVTAVVRQYYALLNAPTTVANGQKLAALMTAKCTCRRVATSTIDAARKGETYFGRTTVTSITPIVDSSTRAEALVQYDYTASGLRDSSGRDISRTPPGRGAQLLFSFGWTGNDWLISGARAIRPGAKT